MEILQTTHDAKHFVSTAKQNKQRIAFVPTMGNLHLGHLSLVETAKIKGDCVIVSIFVNPLQFGPAEDFDRYPRTLEADLQLLAKVGVNAVFTPSIVDIYPHGKESHTFVRVPGLSQKYCGASRPGHFDGVSTVVAKLFGIIQPQYAIFGEKDYQQYLLIKRMVADLSYPIEIIGIPTVRETNGLALSSRNQYLSLQERAIAPMLFQQLSQAKTDILNQTPFTNISKNLISNLTALGFEVDYFAICDADSLEEIAIIASNMILLIAAYIGKTRLIDNLKISLDLFQNSAGEQIFRQK